MFKFDAHTLKLLIAPVLRKPKMLEFVNDLLGFTEIVSSGTIAGLFQSFFSWRTTTNQYLGYSGQTLSLEYLLSQTRPGSVQADVVIEDSARTDQVYLHNYGEPFDIVFLMNTDEDDPEPLWLSNKEEYNAEVDFIVRVQMVAVGTDYKKHIRSIVDQFKVAGKTYLVKGTDE